MGKGKDRSLRQKQVSIQRRHKLIRNNKTSGVASRFFQGLVTDNIIIFIVEQSNLKFVQDNVNKPAPITEAEMEKFIGDSYFYVLCKIANIKDVLVQTLRQGAGLQRNDV